MESEVDEVELAATSNTVIVTSPSGYNPDLWQPTHMHDTILTPSEPSSLPSSSPAEEQSSTQYSTILPWKAVKNLHWDILFLLGGGLALSLGFQVRSMTSHCPFSLAHAYAYLVFPLLCLSLFRDVYLFAIGRNVACPIGWPA